MWGTQQKEWTSIYMDALSHRYNITCYDCHELGGVDMSTSDQEIIHKQFVDFGIENAVQRLCSIETMPTTYIGLSVGGVIAWKAGLAELPIQHIFAISSTRLRTETVKPTCPINLYYGENDPYKPSLDWLSQMGCEYEIVKDRGHDLYKDEGFIKDRLLEQFLLNGLF